MKIKLLTAIVAGGVVLAGCKTMESADVGGLLDSGSTAMKAMTLTDDDVVTLSNDSCAAMDAQNKVNAWAMANGCIRVYSGLMDLMNDDELRGVIGHEIGHVALGHSKKRMQTAYAASAARSIAANSGNSALASLSRSQAGDLGEKFINAQFSQSQESAADDYSFDLLTEKKMSRQGLVTSFQKLAKLSGGSGGSSILSSHPPSEQRAKRMQDRIDGK